MGELEGGVLTKGGSDLGVRDVCMVNLSLLAKWRWRLLQVNNALWKCIVVERYSPKVGDLLEVGEGMWPRNASRWWKDLVSLSKGMEVEWFNEEVARSVGNGMSTSFWKVPWKRNVPFMVKFNRLYSISTNQEALIHDLWRPRLFGGEWAFNWRRNLFVWENNLLTELLGDLNGFVGSIEDERWRWSLEEDNSFLVKSMYLKLEGREIPEVGHPEGERRVFHQIWKTGPPSKVIAFLWKALLDRISARVNLEKQNCLPIDIGSNCVWCGEVVGNTLHLFLHCDLARNVWLNLMLWLNLNFVMPPNLFIHWECWSGGFYIRRFKRA